MPAILRVKRKRDEEPASVLLVGQKRRKVDHEEKSLDKITTESRFHLAATFHTNQPLDKTALKNALLKRKAEEEPSTLTTSSNKNSVQQVKSSAVKQAKTEIPWSSLEFAEANLEEVDGDQQKENLLIKWQSCCDKEKPAVLCNGEQMVRSKGKTISDDTEEYVYDLYHVEENNADSKISIDDFLYVKPYVELEMVPEEDEEENDYADDDDSNDENNWRNDYPEEGDSEDEKSSDENSENFGYSGRGASMLDDRRGADNDSSMDYDMRASMTRMRLSEDDDEDYYS